jgi:hypothetical protein
MLTSLPAVMRTLDDELVIPREVSPDGRTVRCLWINGYVSYGERDVHDLRESGLGLRQQDELVAYMESLEGLESKTALQSVTGIPDPVRRNRKTTNRGANER